MIDIRQPTELLECLEQLPNERILLSYDQVQVTATRLCEWVRVHRQQMLDSQECILVSGEPISTIVRLLAMDGRVERVFLVPQSLAESEVFVSLCDQFTLMKDRAAPNGTGWLLATSGTTGTPKLIQHSSESLTRSLKREYNQGAEYRWGLVYEPFRFAGLQVLLQSLLAGSELVICHHLPFEQQLERLVESRVNALSATPTFWRKVLFHGGLNSLTFKQITLGGEAVDQTLLNALARQFPQARITHIYAATETGVGFSIADGLEGFPASWLLHGQVDQQGAINLLQTQTGTLGIKLPGQINVIDTGDLITQRGDRIVFLGRQSGAINVGGNKVIPEEVEQVIRLVPGVAEVRVVGKGSSLVGQLVSCEVLPTSDAIAHEQLKHAILQQCRLLLPRYKVPALIRFTTELEINATGKLVRKSDG